MDVMQLRQFLSLAPSHWKVMFEYEDSTQDTVELEGSFEVDEVVFDITNEVLVLRSVD